MIVRELCCSVLPLFSDLCPNFILIPEVDLSTAGAWLQFTVFVKQILSQLPLSCLCLFHLSTAYDIINYMSVGPNYITSSVTLICDLRLASKLVRISLFSCYVIYLCE